MNLKSLKTYIKSRLQTASGLSVHSVNAPPNASCPYIVFKFNSLSTDVCPNRDDRVLEIEYWDDKMDDTDILNASELVRKSFDYSWQNETEGFFTMYLDWEGEIPDIDTNISRIGQRYIIKARRVIA